MASPTSQSASPSGPTLSRPTLIADALRQEIGDRFRPEDRLPSMRDLCRRFGVSINTISSALDMLARDGLVEKRHGSGVYVLGPPARQRIGIVSELDLLDPRIGPFFRLCARELNQQLRAVGAVPILYLGHAVPGDAVNEEPTCPQFWQDAAAGNIDGGILLDLPNSTGWWSRVQKLQVPVVGHHSAHRVVLNYDDAIRKAVDQLTANGGRRLALLAGTLQPSFCRLVDAAGAETRDAWIRCHHHPSQGGGGWEQFREIWLTDGERPDSLLVLDDMLFAEAHIAALELGVHVPEDLQVAVLTTRSAPPTTAWPIISLEIDPAEVATKMIDMLMRQVRGETMAPCVQSPSLNIIQHTSNFQPVASQ